MPPTFRPNKEAETMLVAAKPDGSTLKIEVGKSGTLAAATGECEVHCPLCGSPYLATFATGDPKYNEPAEVVIRDARRSQDEKGKAKPFFLHLKRALPDFTCTAGDCNYAGPIGRN